MFYGRRLSFAVGLPARGHRVAGCIHAELFGGRLEQVDPSNVREAENAEKYVCKLVPHIIRTIVHRILAPAEKGQQLSRFGRHQGCEVLERVESFPIPLLCEPSQFFLNKRYLISGLTLGSVKG